MLPPEGPAARTANQSTPTETGADYSNRKCCVNFRSSVRGALDHERVARMQVRGEPRIIPLERRDRRPISVRNGKQRLADADFVVDVCLRTGDRSLCFLRLSGYSLHRVS